MLSSHRHERACGFYRTSVYFLAKLLCEAMPIKLGPILFFFPILYTMTGLRKSFAAMFFFETTCLCMGTAAAGIFMFSVLLFDHVSLGYVIAGIILSFMMVICSCFLFNHLCSLSVVSSWTWYRHGGWGGVVTCPYSGMPTPHCPSMRSMEQHSAPCQRISIQSTSLVHLAMATSAGLPGKIFKDVHPT